MPLSLQHPGVYIEEVPSGVRTITGVATSIGLFIGWAARGPVDRATRISSFADYERAYGGLDQRTLLGYSVQQFFNNGGADAYVIRVAATGGSGAGAATTSSGDLSFTAASPGEWARNYSVRITPRTDDPAFKERFKIEVFDDPDKKHVVEVYENLSMKSADARFASTVINDHSPTITVTVASTANPPTAADTKTFGGGSDGDVLDPNSTNTTLQAAFHSAVLALFGTGAIADRIDIFNLVCVPGESNPDTVQKLQNSCFAKRAFLIVDCTQDQAVSGAAAEAVSMSGGAPSYAAYYFPWVRASDPLQQGAVRAFPPCGFIAGICARTDAARGVWKAPAGSETTLTGLSAFKCR